MLADTLTLNDGTADQSFQLISREGMSSKRRNVTAGVPSTAMAALTIKHTIDEKSKTKPNRHLLQTNYTEVDAAGIDRGIQVHVVITRDKKATDDQVLKCVAIVADAISDTAIVGQLLIGGN